MPEETQTRYVADGVEFEERAERDDYASRLEAKARENFDERLQAAREQHAAELERLRDLGLEDGELPSFAAPPAPRPVELGELAYRLVYDVVSGRDGEVVICGVDAETAKREAVRLTEQQRERRAEAPVHTFVREAPESDLGIADTPAMVPSEPLAPTEYRAVDRLELATTAEEA